MQTEKKSLSTNLIYFFGALGGLLFGYDTGVISGAIYLLKSNCTWVSGNKVGLFQPCCLVPLSVPQLLDHHQISMVVVSC